MIDLLLDGKVLSSRKEVQDKLFSTTADNAAQADNSSTKIKKLEIRESSLEPNY